MTIVNVIQARNDLFNMVDSVQDGEKIIITSKERNAVLMSEDEYNSLVETLYLLSDPDMASDLRYAKEAPLSEMELWSYTAIQEKPQLLSKRKAADGSSTL